MLRWFAEQWGHSVGVVLQTTLDFGAIRAHLRSNLSAATDSSGKKFLLRFYDPRVLCGLLATASTQEAEPFFGPILAWCCEDAGGDHLLTFAPRADGVFCRKEPVGEARAAAAAPANRYRRA